MEGKQKKNLIKDFNKIFNIKEESEKEPIINEKDLIGYSDPANVCMIIPLKKSFKNFLTTNFEIEEKPIPTLDYSQNSKEPNIKSKYSCEYLNILLNLTKYYHSVTFEIKPDYPLRVTTEDFIFILAPRVDND